MFFCNLLPEPAAVEFKTSSTKPLVDCSANCANAADLDYVRLFRRFLQVLSEDGLESSNLWLLFDCCTNCTTASILYYIRFFGNMLPEPVLAGFETLKPVIISWLFCQLHYCCLPWLNNVFLQFTPGASGSWIWNLKHGTISWLSCQLR